MQVRFSSLLGAFSHEPVLVYICQEDSVILVKLFILGNPGCGKSTVARHLQMLVQGYGWLPAHINDYKILKRMFLEDTVRRSEERQFAPSEQEGFNVMDFTALDTALQRLELEAMELLVQDELTPPRPLLALIEFARNNYQHAFRQFRRDFFQDAYFLYLDTPIGIGKQRIQKRVTKPLEERTIDDHFVSNYTFDTYYKYGSDNNVLAFLAHLYGIDERRIQVIHNDTDLEEVLPAIVAFVLPILKDSIAANTSATLTQAPFASPERPAGGQATFFQPSLL